MGKQLVMIDGNEACARVAHRINEVVAIYPITPSSSMGELADQWSSEGQSNLWGAVPLVVEMQAEGGAAGAVHGALQAGALTTTFTASQGLLLMIPNMYKIAGELTAGVIHVAARSLAAQALSIFGDHSDVMAARNTGFALLASGSVQEAHDMALIAQAASLESRLPFIHFFDGFRTSHEETKIELLEDEDLRALIDDELVFAHRERGLNPDRPVMRGTAQNPDVYFQARETVNRFYDAAPDIVQSVMNEFGKRTGRHYRIFDYYGAKDAEKVVVLMGSAIKTAEATVDYLAAQGEKVGMIAVRLYRPFDGQALVNALPKTVTQVAVLDRTKEPGATGEPMYLDVVAALAEAHSNGRSHLNDMPRVLGGRYGLSSKEFTPAMVRAVFDELGKPNARRHFTVGITDDVTHLSLDVDPTFDIEPADMVRAVFYGLGADGTVGANKNSIKIIGEETDNYAQGYFVYDSKKSGSVTVSHLRFGPREIKAPYLVSTANFVAVHQFSFLERFDVLGEAAEGAVFLLNSPYGPVEVWDYLPKSVQETIIAKKLKFYVIDGYQVAKDAGMGRRVNTVMQVCFFAISGVLERDEAIRKIKGSIEKTYGKRGAEVVRRNFAAVDAALDNLHQVTVPDAVTSDFDLRPVVSDKAPDFVKRVTARMMARKGEQLKVGDMPIDGTYPTATTQWEKRNITTEIPVWNPDICIQCGKCVNVCPHAVIRAKVFDPATTNGNRPAAFKSADARFKELKGMQYTLQIAPEDCTGCALCVEVCPVKDKTEVKKKAINMADQLPLREQEAANWDYFLSLPDLDRTALNFSTVKDVQLLRPLFEFSGACAGCGETPYIKLLSQLYGDRLVVANATGCSSIYGGNLPTTPYAKDEHGRGPAWSNSLFEDNAEFGFGMRIALDHREAEARRLLTFVSPALGSDIGERILALDQKTEAGIQAARDLVVELKRRLQPIEGVEVNRLFQLADALVRKAVWIVGGDGWAYDIGYGGLDHVLAQGRDVNVLVMDTEVYSNTGGQMSKATPRAAVAKFAAAGKPAAKKDLGLMMTNYGNIYVARVAMGANDAHTLKAFQEAAEYDGPSLIIAYTHCIAHGYDMRFGLQQQKAAERSGYWPLYRFDPRRAEAGLNPFQLDSKPPNARLEDYMYQEGRFRMLKQSKPEHAETLLKLAKEDVAATWARYEALAAEKTA